MEFPLLAKKTQRRTDRDDLHEEEDESSNSSESIFSHNVTVKTASPAQDTQVETRNEDAR